jgi:hypothetical protein
VLFLFQSEIPPGRRPLWPLRAGGRNPESQIERLDAGYWMLVLVETEWWDGRGYMVKAHGGTAPFGPSLWQRAVS